MRVAIIYRPRDAAPPEAVPMMLDAMGQRVRKYRARLSTLEFFVGGGGFGVIDTNDPAARMEAAG